METGTIISQYKIISAIGKGGMGEVWLAEDTRLARQVALKLLPAEFTQDAERVRRFMQEAKAASALNHPNIITVYDIGESEAGRFIVMELVAGRTLREVIATDNSAATVLALGQQMAKALSAAHAASITHRDIKPDNIMVREDGYVKVLDFGLARLLATNSGDSEAATLAQQTTPGTIMGTVAYMSPEQARGESVGPPSDIFALGIVLYELATGRHPFQAETLVGYLHAITLQEPAPPQQWQPKLPAGLNDLILRMLHKEARQRPTASEVAQTLVEAEYRSHSADNEAVAAQTMMLPQPTAAAPAALATAAVSAQPTSPDNLKPKPWWLAAGLSLLLVIGGYFGYGYFTATKQIESIAVLPFENKSSDADSEYLSDGLAESLIYRLSQLPNLKVSPTSSVFRYKGKETDPQIIANELGVDSVLTGRIIQRGDSLSISVNLVDIRNNKSLWGEQIERKMSELLATQQAIATEITNKLQLKLSGESEQKLAKKYTDNNEAYQLYLKGRYLLFKQSKDDIKSGIEYFQQAIKLDPNFALAYVGIANSYLDMASYPYISSREAAPLAKAAVQRALIIDPDLAEAHTSLAYVLAFHDYNWGESGREFTLAIELNPNIAEVHHYYSHQYLLPFGRFDDALKESTRAFELEPLSIAFNAPLAGTYLYVRQNKQSVEQAKKTLELDPNHVQALSWVSYIYNANGMYPEALELYERAKKLGFGDNQDLLALAGYAYAKTGRRREAEEIIDKFKEISKTGVILHSFVANIYATLGDKDKAFAELEKGFEERDYFMPRIKVDPFVDPLRDDPRYKDLLKRMGLPE